MSAVATPPVALESVRHPVEIGRPSSLGFDCVVTEVVLAPIAPLSAEDQRTTLRLSVGGQTLLLATALVLSDSKQLAWPVPISALDIVLVEAVEPTAPFPAGFLILGVRRAAFGGWHE